MSDVTDGAYKSSSGFCLHRLIDCLIVCVCVFMCARAIVCCNTRVNAYSGVRDNWTIEWWYTLQEVGPTWSEQVTGACLEGYGLPWASSYVGAAR